MDRKDGAVASSVAPNLEPDAWLRADRGRPRAGGWWGHGPGAACVAPAGERGARHHQPAQGVARVALVREVDALALCTAHSSFFLSET